MNTRVSRIIELARWAPSGDNTQPWRFTVKDEGCFTVNGYDTSSWCVYDLEGRASQIALGALLENIAIAASKEKCRAIFKRHTEIPKGLVRIEVRLVSDESIQTDCLIDYISVRVTNRRAFSMKRLSPLQKEKLELSVGKGVDVFWLEGWQNRFRMANILFRNAKIRLTIPEAYKVHKDIIEWGATYSKDKIPEKAVGVNPLTARLMRWAMQDWGRVHFLNRYLGGTLLPRLELDVLPAFGCASHFILAFKKVPDSIDDQLNAGRKLQRFWLTATAIGLQFQPEMTPLIFSDYVKKDIKFTVDNRAGRSANQLSSRLGQLLGKEQLERSFFMARIGFSKPPVSRSTRLPLSELIKPSNGLPRK